MVSTKSKTSPATKNKELQGAGVEKPPSRLQRGLNKTMENIRDTNRTPDQRMKSAQHYAMRIKKGRKEKVDPEQLLADIMEEQGENN